MSNKNQPLTSPWINPGASRGDSVKIENAVLSEKVAAAADPAAVKDGASGDVKAQSQQVGFGMTMILTVFVSVIINGACLVAYDYWRAPKFVSVDLKGHIAKQQELYLAGKISDDQFIQGLANVDKIIKALPKNRVVVMGDAVINGVEKIDLAPAANASSK